MKIIYNKDFDERVLQFNHFFLVFLGDLIPQCRCETLIKSARSIPLFIDNQACLSVTNHPNNSTKSRHIALREFRIRDYHELGMIRPYWCPGNYNVADFFSKLLEKGLFTMHAHRFGMNFEETIVGKLAEVYQTVHLKEFTDFPKKDEKDPTTVFTDIHFEKKSVAYEAYHLSHGHCL